MASRAGRVRIRGRFPDGSNVTITKVKDESVLRPPAGAKDSSTATVKDGEVSFTAEIGARYLVTGYRDGFPIQVRAVGRKPGEESTQLTGDLVTNDRVRLANGAWADEAPERDVPKVEVHPGPAQHQVPEGTVQRSDTPLGIATPVDPDETLPYPHQGEKEYTSGKTLQRSDTELGMATPHTDGPGKQEDSPKGLLQRSDTPLGIQTPIPGAPPVKAKEEQDASDTKAAKGEPVKAAADPENTKTVRKPTKRRTASTKKNTTKKGR